MSHAVKTNAPEDMAPPSAEAANTYYLVPERSEHADAAGFLLPPLEARRWREPVLQGTVLGRFLVLEKLGAGGMGVVYAAYDPSLNRRVALKLLLVESTAEDDAGDARSRLMREAQALAQLSHPSVVAVYEVGEHDGDVFIAMEYVEGQTLRDWLEAKKRGWREVLQICIEAGRGLAAAHAAGLVHRDFKPANVLVGSDGRVRVMDFGLARPSSADATKGDYDAPAGSREVSEPSGALLHSDVTRYGVLMGTPAYMAPEQRKGVEADARTDQFSYCVSMFEALYGHKPDRDRAASTLVPRGSKVPPWVHRVLVQGLQEAPDKRFASMDALLQALLDDPSVRRKKWLGIAGAALLVPATAFGAASWQNQKARLCNGAQDKLTGVWDPERSEQVEAAMLATGASYAPGVWAYVQPKLDDYARAWAQEHQDACEATNMRGEQSIEVLDLRMACLHRAKDKLNAAASVLASADAATVQKASDVVDGLDRLARCSDVGGLRALVEPPAPEEVEAVARVRELLAHATALRTAGRYSEAESSLQEIEAQLTTLTYEPVRTEVLLERGQLLWRGPADYPASEAALREVIRLGSTWHQWTEVRDSATVLLHVLGNRRARPQEALQHLDLAWGLAAAQEDLAAQAQIHNNLGNVLFGSGRFEEAEAEYRRALDLREKLLEPGHPLVAQTRTNLGGALGEQGRYEEAESELRQARVLMERALGSEHPDVAAAIGNLGRTFWYHGRHDEAEAQHRHALAVWLKAYGPDHPQTALAHHNIGLALWSRGRLEDAEVRFRQALTSFEQTLEPHHDWRVESQHWLARALLDRDRAAEALPLAELAWAARQRDGVRPEQQAEAAFVLARALSASGGDESRARALAEHAGEAYARAGEMHRDALDEVRAWLRDRA